MRPVDVKQLRHADMVARYRDRRFVLRTTAFIGSLCAIMGGALYLLFFLPAFTINTLTFSGLQTIDPSGIRTEIESVLHQKKLKYFAVNKNILFFNTAVFSQQIRSEYPNLKSVTATKDFFHGLIFNFQERTPLGVWCFRDDCKFFDDEGVAWGRAPHTSGGLLISVQDNRSQPLIDQETLSAIRTIVTVMPTIGVGIRTITIPVDIQREVRVTTTAGYDLLVDIDSNIPVQLHALKVFLDQKAGPDFHPAYIDLRIEGRLYYK